MDRQTPQWPQTQRIGPVHVAASTPHDIISFLVAITRNRDAPGPHMHLVNAYTLSLADKDSSLSDLLADTNALNLPDGKPLTWVSTLRSHRPRLKQIRGPRLFTDALDHGREMNLKHYLLGSTEHTLQKLVSEIHNRYPGTNIVGTFSPPFRPLTDEERAQINSRLLESDADIIWVGLGTPKQDFEAHRITHSLNVTSIAVGAAFDFLAGTSKEAPVWVRKVGLEWLYRLSKEPRRLWRRYLIGNVQFLRAVYRPKRRL